MKNADFAVSWKASWPGGKTRIAARPKCISSTRWQSNFCLDLPTLETDVEELELCLSVPCTEAWFLSARRQFCKVRGHVLTPRPLGRFVIVRTHAGLRRLEVSNTPGLEIIERSDRVDVRAPMIYKRGCGLLLWGKNKLGAPVRASATLISVSHLEELDDCAWIEPYPNGARAAICLTDHADFDVTEKVELLAATFARYNFQCTKSVFPGGSEPNSRYGPGLDDAAYRDAVTALYSQGSEICFHGFGPARDAPSIAECIKRIEAAQAFKPTTWIDHGTGSYLFSREARLREGVSLTALLLKFGIHNFWSYTDIWNNPTRRIGSWLPQRRSLITEFLRGAGAMSNISPSKIAYLTMHGLKNVIGDEGVAALRSRAYSPTRWRNAVDLLRRLRSVRDTPMLIYGFDGTSFAASISEPWVFDSTLLNHLSLQLAPASVDQLSLSSETLVAHCYFSEQHPYGFDNCFIGSGRQLRLIPEFERDLAYIADRQREGKVIALPFARLRSALTAFARSSLERIDSGWRVRLVEGDAPVTVGLPSTVTHPVRQDTTIHQTTRENVSYFVIVGSGTVNIGRGPSTTRS